MRDSREKGAGMRDQDPPFQTLTLALEILRERATICQFLQLSVTFNLGRDSGYFCNDTRIQMRVKFSLLCTLVGNIQFS